MKHIGSGQYQSTESELLFLHKIGEWQSGVGIPEKVRQHYLRGYLKGCYKRVNWGRIDREIILKYVEKELGKE